MKIPESISALSTKHNILWTFCMWILSFTGICFMCPFNETFAIIAFLSCACIGFIGLLPLVKDTLNTAHNILGIGGCLLSQLWCGLVGNWQFLIAGWLLYLILLPFMKSKWCFFVEIWCLLNIIIVRFIL